MRNTAADIIARSCRGNNKKIRDEVDGKNEKTVSRISTRERYTSSTSIVPRMLERVHSTFHAASTSNCVSRELKAIFSTICFDEMPRERKSGSLARSRMARSNNKWLGKHLTAARKYVPGENVLFQSSRVGRIKAERKVFNVRSPT